MIFLTVGTQLPFDRLTKTVDAWCAASRQAHTVFGQIGQLGSESHRPEHFDWAERVTPEEFDQHVAKASIIISHAGMGSIITAVSRSTPIIILPRRVHLGEQRNDHQFATAERMRTRPGVFTAMTEDALIELIDHVIAKGGSGAAALPPFANPELIKAVQDFIHSPSGA